MNQYLIYIFVNPLNVCTSQIQCNVSVVEHMADLSMLQMDIIMNTLVNEICLSKWKISPVEQMDYQLHAVNILSKCLRR